MLSGGGSLVMERLLSKRPKRAMYGKAGLVISRGHKFDEFWTTHGLVLLGSFVVRAVIGASAWMPTSTWNGRE